jgi:phage shock protein C
MKKLYRSQNNRRIAGVCGGLGETYDIDPTLLRLLFVFLTLISGVLPMVVVYIVGWIIIPVKPQRDREKA